MAMIVMIAYRRGIWSDALKQQRGGKDLAKLLRSSWGVNTPSAMFSSVEVKTVVDPAGALRSSAALSGMHARSGCSADMALTVRSTARSLPGPAHHCNLSGFTK